MNEVLIKALQLILSLSILVIVHELGHFFFARLFKTRVEKFYLFFNPWFSIVKRKIGDTEYGIGWLPLGGYVKIAGMIDESMDKEQLKQPPQPHEFRSKKSWQRLLIMLGGILFNVLLAFFIYSMVLFTWGEKYLPASSAKYGIMTDSLGKSIGLRNGDIILALDDKPVDNFRKIVHDILLEDIKSIKVKRGDSILMIAIPNEVKHALIKNPTFIEVRFPFIVDGFIENSVAEKAGLIKGDKFLSINSESAIFFDEVREKLSKYRDKDVEIKVLRNNKDTISIHVSVPNNGKLGVYPLSDLEKFFELKKIQYNFFESLPAGVIKTFDMLDSYIKQFKLLFSPETKAYESIGGFITIGKIFPAEWDWMAFWSMTAFLSVILAFMNFLPIPALDGGHVLFLLYEIVTRRKPSEKFLEYAQIVGMALLFALLIFANGNDIIKLFK
ncbi:MAG: RIP metalloprotease RseP [Bacteroidales bacterium]|nr:RIP metalloprotease RseP [Bacteroidales bacterium]